MQKYLLLCLFFTSCHSQLLSAATQVYKCTTSNGAVTFSDKACAASTTTRHSPTKSTDDNPCLKRKHHQKSAFQKKEKTSARDCSNR